MKTILLISPYWKEPHRWMVSSYKLAELWQRLGYRVVVVCMGAPSGQVTGSSLAGYGSNSNEQRANQQRESVENVSDTLRIYRKQDVFLKDPLNFGVSLGFTGYARRIIEAEKPDHIVVNKVLFWSSFSVISLRLQGYRITLLTDVLGGMTWWPRPFFAKVLMFVEAWTVGWLVMRCAERIVFFHPQPERLLGRLGVSKKSRVIPTGIDPAPYHGSDDSRIVAAGGKITVTYIGRLESVKGVDDFLAAAVPLTTEHPQLRIRVVGWHRDGHPLVAEYRDRVEFTGLRDDIPAQLAATDIFVLPSYSEGLSNALMEAMASGCACVASDVGGNRYLLQNGVSGLLFPAGDREALRAHIRRLIGDPAKRRSLGQAARRRIDEVFSWDVVAKRYKELFEES